VLSALMSRGVGREPVFWLLIASGFAGVAISAATRSAGRSREPERVEVYRTRKWTIFSFAMSGVVAAWLLAVFVPGSTRVADAKYLYFFLASSMVLAAAIRFPRTAGLLVFAAALAGASALAILKRAVRPFTEETEIARLVVYSRRGDVMDAELRSPGRPLEHVRLEGEVVVPLVSIFVFDDLWPFMGWHTWYRLEGVSGAGFADGAGNGRLELQSEPFRYPPPQGLPESLYRWVGEHSDKVPGLKVTRAAEGKAAAAAARRIAMEELKAYAIRLTAEGWVYLAESADDFVKDR